LIVIGYLYLLPLGLIIGLIGSFVGSGGGFMVVPMLLILFPSESPEIITAISLTVVFLCGLSGTVAYGRLERTDYKSGILFLLASIPGAILGALSTSHLDRGLFNAVFGSLMITISVYLMLRPFRPQSAKAKGGRLSVKRKLVKTDGSHFIFSYNPLMGTGLNLVLGYVSALLGIGGGTIRVALLTHLLNFPVRMATATSTFILTGMALSATLVHVATGSFQRGFRRMGVLSVGVIIGAQIGARLSHGAKDIWIIRTVAVVLLLVGFRVLIMAF